jgi:predicted dehydrogenase
LKLLVERGDLGHLYSVLHVYRDFQDFEGSWFVQTPYATTLDHGVHYFDLLRHFTERVPSVVKAGAAMVPGQLGVSPMIHTVVCEYDSEDALLATLHFNNIVSARSSHHYEWHLDGTLGSASATLTHLRVSGADRESRLTELEGSWYVDAFAAAMAEMLDAVVTGRTPLTSGRDHLDSLQIAMDAIRSATTGTAVAFGSAGEVPHGL